MNNTAFAIGQVHLLNTTAHVKPHLIMGIEKAYIPQSPGSQFSGKKLQAVIIWWRIDGNGIIQELICVISSGKINCDEIGLPHKIMSLSGQSNTT